MWTSLAAPLVAIVVGHNGAPAPDVPALRYADDDAAAYARLFRDAGAHVTLLARYDADTRALNPDAAPQAAPTREALLAAVETVPEGAEAYLVYTGHGDVAGGEGFVQLEGGRLSRSDLYDRVLARLRAARAHVLVDACKSYFLVFERGPGGERRPYAGSFVDARGPERFPRVGFVLSTSAAADSHEWEEWQGGVFSHEVRSGLRGAADADGDARVSYLELGAFVRRANESVPNPRFRPRFTVVAPRASADGGGTPLLAWDGAPARKLVVGAAVGRLSVEDRLGRRLADANPAAPTALQLPGDALFVRADREWEVPAGGDARLEDLAARPPEVARRGALHEAFKHLFALPFGPAAVAEYLRAPPDIAPEAAVAAAPPPARPWQPKVRRVAGWAAVGLAVAGVALTSAAYAVRSGAEDASGADRAGANDTIGALNVAAIACYAAGAAAGATWLALRPTGDD